MGGGRWVPKEHWGDVVIVDIYHEVELVLEVTLIDLSLGPLIRDLTNVLWCPVRNAHHQ